MERITLGQLLQYFDCESEPVDKIQVATEKQEWDDAAELAADSELLRPFMGFYVESMGLEDSLTGRKTVIRVSICKDNQKI